MPLPTEPSLQLPNKYFKIIFILYVYVLICLMLLYVTTCTHVGTQQSREKSTGLLEAGLQVCVDCLIRVLGSELWTTHLGSKHSQPLGHFSSP